jgi:nicotinamide phosphoribosyltransferase
MIFNPAISTDSYKLSHFMQLPDKTTRMKSYVTARGTKIPGVNAVVVAGLQIFIYEFLQKRITRQHIALAEAFCAKHGTPFNREGFEIIVAEHGGYFPVTIRSVDEGTPVPLNELMISVENNDDRLPWAVSFIETILLSYIWYCSSVATKSREIKRIIRGALVHSSDDPEAELPFKLHDFGYRGAAPGAAHVGAFGHLINFMGTDTICGIEAAMEYYESDVCGYSISASEHSTMTSWGRENEYEAYANMVKQYAKPGAIFACVIDSYDTFNAIQLWAKPQKGNRSLLDQVAEAGATVVLRPDSGNPVTMPIKVIEQLMLALPDEVYVNIKGFNVLPNHVRVIQGDGIDIEQVREILFTMMSDYKMSASNIAFGMGGGLLQKVDRDTFKFAMKTCRAVINEKVVSVAKDPITDQGKKSKEGDLALYFNTVTKEYKTINLDKEKVIFEGEWIRKDHVVWSHYGNQTTFNTITMDRVRANAAL